MLMIPGPTPVPTEVLEALARHPIGHRSADFKKVLARIQPRLSWLFNTQRPVYTYAASGTGGMEAALCNVLSSGDELLVVSCGVFSERFAEIAKTFGYIIHHLSVDYGQANTPEQITEFLKTEAGKKVKAVCLIHNETSTAVLNPLPELIQAIKQNSDALVIVDTITGLGAAPFEFDTWGIDIAVSGSQKGFMLPPGLAFIAVSQKALDVHAQNKTSGYYFNFSKYEKTVGDLQTPYTSAVTLMFGLDVALEMLENEGQDNTFARHHLNKTLVRNAVTALGLKLLVENEPFASPSATAICPPEGITVDAIRKGLRETYGITVADGQKNLKGNIFRVGHLGAIFPRDVLTTISSLECVLASLGYQFELGTGVKSVQQTLLQSQKQPVSV